MSRIFKSSVKIWAKLNIRNLVKNYPVLHVLWTWTWIVTIQWWNVFVWRKFWFQDCNWDECCPSLNGSEFWFLLIISVDSPTGIIFIRKEEGWEGWGWGGRELWCLRPLHHRMRTTAAQGLTALNSTNRTLNIVCTLLLSIYLSLCY